MAVPYCWYQWSALALASCSSAIDAARRPRDIVPDGVTASAAGLDNDNDIGVGSPVLAVKSPGRAGEDPPVGGRPTGRSGQKTELGDGLIRRQLPSAQIAMAALGVQSRIVVSRWVTKSGGMSYGPSSSR